MSNIPIILKEGSVLLYGNITRRSSLYNISAFNTSRVRMNWGTVSDVYDGAALVTVGQQILFNGNDLTAVLKYNGGRYYMIDEAKLVTIENQ